MANMTGVDLTPNFDKIFRQMIQEARNQGEASAIVYGIPATKRVEVLRAIQRFLAPLAIAANCMTNAEMVEQFRDAITAINAGIDTRASEMENQ